MNFLLKSIGYGLILFALMLVLSVLTGCSTNSSGWPVIWFMNNGQTRSWHSHFSKVQSWWETQNVTNPDQTQGASLVPDIKSKSKVSMVSKPPMPTITWVWITEWRDTNGNIQPSAISVVRSSTNLQTVKQGIIRLVARTNQITVPRPEQQEFFAVANDYARNYTN